RYLVEGAGSLLRPQSPVVCAVPEFVQCRSLRILAEAAVFACRARGWATENRSRSDTFRQQKYPIATSVWAGEAGERNGRGKQESAMGGGKPESAMGGGTSGALNA